MFDTGNPSSFLSGTLLLSSFVYSLRLILLYIRELLLGEQEHFSNRYSDDYDNFYNTD